MNNTVVLHNAGLLWIRLPIVVSSVEGGLCPKLKKCSMGSSHFFQVIYSLSLEWEWFMLVLSMTMASGWDLFNSRVNRVLSKSGISN